METKQRLLSIDTLRGFDMFFIMGFAELVIALCGVLPFDWAQALASQMTHPEWNGFSHHDTIFPLFLFLAGASFPFSLSSQRRKGIPNTKIYKKITVRALTLFALGLVYNGFMKFNFDTCRIPSVLGRIGIAWALAALIYMHSTAKIRIAVSVLILVGYSLLIGFVPSPDFVGEFTSLTIDNNLAGYVDSAIMPGHLYLENFDPEGLMSTIPAIVTALLGMFAGDIVRGVKHSGATKTLQLLAIGAGLLVVGFVVDSEFMPTNKSLWTAPFVCFAGAYSFVMLALFYYIIDVKGFVRWTFFFKVIGLNSILIYMAQAVINIGYTNNFLFGGIINMFGEGAAEVLFFVGYIALCWGLLYFCYKKNIFLKV